MNDFLTSPLVAARQGLSHDAINAVITAAEAADATCALTSSDDHSCAICLEVGLGARLACGHAFHAGCIRSWLVRGGETCPLCCCTIRAPASMQGEPLHPADMAMVNSVTGVTALILHNPADVDADHSSQELGPVVSAMGSMHRIPTARRTFTRLPTGLRNASRAHAALMQPVASAVSEPIIDISTSSEDDDRPLEGLQISGTEPVSENGDVIALEVIDLNSGDADTEEKVRNGYDKKGADSGDKKTASKR